MELDGSLANNVDLDSIGTSLFDFDQSEILRITDRTITTAQSRQRMGKRFSWNKFNEDVVCRVVIEFLEKHLRPSKKPVGPGVFIHDYPVEFDLMITQSQAQPIRFTNSFGKESVSSVVEIKSQGYLDTEYPHRLRSAYEQISGTFPHIHCAYLSLNETWKPKGPDSISHVEHLKKILEPEYPVFCLRDSNTGEVFRGQWERFVNTLQGQI